MAEVLYGVVMEREKAEKWESQAEWMCEKYTADYNGYKLIVGKNKMGLWIGVARTRKTVLSTYSGGNPQLIKASLVRDVDAYGTA